MVWENKEGQGALFRNNSDNPKAPSHKGDFMLNGAMYSISAWVKEGKNGKFFILKVEPKQQREAPKAAKPAPVDDEFNDDVPF